MDHPGLRDTIAGMLIDVIDALTAPLTEEEMRPAPVEDCSHEELHRHPG